MSSKRGVILLVLMLMLLFAAPLLVQFGEDNYFMRLLARQVDDLVRGRLALSTAFSILSTQYIRDGVCETASYSKGELESFWLVNANSCQIISSGKAVNYAVYRYEQDEENTPQQVYQQYTLRAGNNWLRVVVDEQTAEMVSTLYY